MATDKKTYCMNEKQNRCHRCGIEYDGTNACIFDFHHIEPALKSMSTTPMSQQSMATIKRELPKCVMLCKNCHALVHQEENTFSIMGKAGGGRPYVDIDFDAVKQAMADFNIKEAAAVRLLGYHLRTYYAKKRAQ